MKDGILNRIWRGFTVLMFVMVVVGGGFIIYPNYCQREELLRANSELDEKIAAKQAEIAKLIEYQTRFKRDADFVESIARQNRRVYPGELVFIFED